MNFHSPATVSFGGVLATNPIVVNAGTLTATSPPGTGTVDVIVNTPAGPSATSSADLFTYGAAPSISGLSPNLGPTSGGTTVTITGTNFAAPATVSFTATPATNVVVVNSTTITATSPACTAIPICYPNVRVSVGGLESPITPADHFTYVFAPVVSSVSPDFGPPSGGTTVDIQGGGLFNRAYPPPTVSFGTVPATVVAEATGGGLLEVTSPPGTGIVDVTVTTVGGTSATSSADWFSYGPPIVTGIAPHVGPLSGGTLVSIAGLGNFTAPATVSFGGVPATNVSVTNGGDILATSPPGTGTVDVTVTTAGGTSNTLSADQFTYEPAPTVSGISPNSGPALGGTTVTITGTNFLFTSLIVTFGTYAINVAPVNSTTLTVATPPGTGTVDVTVTTAGGTSATSPADLFTYD
jgi:hypothetical protein